MKSVNIVLRMVLFIIFFLVYCTSLNNTYGQEKNIYLVKTKSKLTQEQIPSELLDFVTYFTKLKIEESGKYAISVVQEDPCTVSNVQTETQNNLPSQTEKNNYVVKIGINNYTTKELSIDYELVTYNKNCSPNSLLNERRPFFKSQVLNTLNEITSSIAFKLEKDVSKNSTAQKDKLVLNSVDIKANNSTIEIPSSFRTELINKFFEELAKNEVGLKTETSSATTNTPNAYRIEVEVTITKVNKSYRVTEIKPIIYTPLETIPVYLPPISKPFVIGEQSIISEQLQTYFSETAQAATEQLIDVYYNTSKLNKDKLLKEALTFMCLKDDYSPIDECVKQPKSAIPLLAKLIRLQKSDADSTLWRLLGEAKLALGDFRAIEDFQTALSKTNSDSSEARIYLLNKLVYAFYKNEDFEQAANRCEESLRLDNKQQEIHIQRITNYIFAKKYKEAITSTVNSLKDLGDLPQNSFTIKTIMSLTNDAVNKLQEVKELEEIKVLLDDNVATLPIINEILQKTNSLITKKLYFVIEEELQKMQPNTKDLEILLQKAEMLKNNIPNVEKEPLDTKHLYLSALVLREKKDFQIAEETLLKILQIKDIKQIKDLQIDANNQAIVFELARTYSFHAESNKEEKYNKHASKILELVVRTNPKKEVYFLLYKVNSILGNDGETKDILESLVSTNKDNVFVLLNCQEVLTNYLYEFSKSSDISEKLERIRKQEKKQELFSVIDLGIIEGYVLDKKFDKATKYISEILNTYIQNASFQSPEFFSILYFYKTWCEIEIKDEQNVDSEKQWKTWIEKASQNNQLQHWFFRGAKYSLDKQNGLQMQKLKDMLEVMFKQNPSTFRQL